MFEVVIQAIARMLTHRHTRHAFRTPTSLTLFTMVT
jgi:hypothetical protein